MRAVFDGPLIGQQPTGTSVHIRGLLGAAISIRPSLELVSRHATLRRRREHRLSAARISPSVRVTTTLLPGKVLRGVETSIRIPRERWLVGPFDLYHQLHLDGDPSVPGKRLVVTIHDMVAAVWPREEGRMHPRARDLVRRAAAICAVSEFTRSVVHHEFDVPLDRIHVVPNGVDTSLFNRQCGNADLPAVRQQLSLPESYVLHVGGSTPRKNINRVISAFEAVSLMEKDLHLLLVGPGTPSMPLKQGLQERVRRLGFVEEAHLPALYAGAEALVFPSLYEGFGIPVLEAFACGTPVVTSNVTSLPEIAAGCATLTDPTDVDAIAGAVSEVLHEDERTRVQRRARALVQAQRFSWQSAAEKLLAVYDSVAQQAGFR